MATILPGASPTRSGLQGLRGPLTREPDVATMRGERSKAAGSSIGTLEGEPKLWSLLRAKGASTCLLADSSSKTFYRLMYIYIYIYIYIYTYIYISHRNRNIAIESTLAPGSQATATRQFMTCEQAKNNCSSMTSCGLCLLGESPASLPLSRCYCIIDELLLRPRPIGGGGIKR